MTHAREDYQRFQDPAGKIGEDEPVMLFRAQDKYFVPVLRAYLKMLREDYETEHNMVNAVDQHIHLAEEWQKEHGCKTPDI